MSVHITTEHIYLIKITENSYKLGKGFPKSFINLEIYIKCTLYGMYIIEKEFNKRFMHKNDVYFGNYYEMHAIIMEFTDIKYDCDNYNRIQLPYFEEFTKQILTKSLSKKIPILSTNFKKIKIIPKNKLEDIMFNMLEYGRDVNVIKDIFLKFMDYLDDNYMKKFLNDLVTVKFSNFLIQPLDLNMNKIYEIINTSKLLSKQLRVPLTTEIDDKFLISRLTFTKLLIAMKYQRFFDSKARTSIISYLKIFDKRCYDTILRFLKDHRWIVFTKKELETKGDATAIVYLK